MTIDYPSKNERGKIPILDLNVWMSTTYNEVDHRPTVNIMHEYYYKEVATKAVINSRAAVPEKMKRTVLTQEIVRILRNCSQLLPWDDVCKHVEEFSMRIQYSGYNETYRAQVVKSALNAYDLILDKDQRGEEPLYRPREWRKVERAMERRAKKE